MRNFLREHYLKLNLLQLSHNMFCKNIARLAVARERIHVWQPLATAKSHCIMLKSIRKLIHVWQPIATAKRATFLQNILWESYSKFNFEQCFLKKFVKILSRTKVCRQARNRVVYSLDHSENLNESHVILSLSFVNTNEFHQLH